MTIAAPLLDDSRGGGNTAVHVLKEKFARGRRHSRVGGFARSAAAAAVTASVAAAAVVAACTAVSYARASRSVLSGARATVPLLSCLRTGAIVARDPRRQGRQGSDSSGSGMRSE
eukprot:CAMPEP_0194314082 /NCGR_PEP_ID=MMETSP0171-20130528/10908_1 /TAXON_ID=218684 /ORGANISM="Corethron pennatum, Strain L29A3" /LENGTH=114 /DNA_ID=CAMNT_0039069317 /DNA_START=462 /DNA_END=808 /DNA_ORIENTATION=+